MASRRMFSARVVQSTKFLKMPLTTQALYFHLGINADDDGIVEAFNVIRMTGCAEDDLRVLATKGYVKVLNEDLVTYITDWNENNKIRPDRKIDSIYKDLLVQINPDAEIVERKTRNDNAARLEAYREGDLPYSFGYKIRKAFWGKPCPLCGCAMIGDIHKPSMQHNIPISKGGAHTLDNISVICHKCNCETSAVPTGSLNNAEVVETWRRIQIAEAKNIKWFYNTKVLEEIDDDLLGQQSADIVHTEDGIGKDSIGEVRKGKVRKGKVRNVCSEPQSDSEPEAQTAVLILNDGSEWRPTVKDYEEWCRVYPNVDVFHEFERMRQWCLSNPTKRKTRRGIRKFVTTWLDGEQNKPRKTTSKLDAIDQWAENMKRGNNEESGIF